MLHGDVDCHLLGFLFKTQIFMYHKAYLLKILFVSRFRLQISVIFHIVIIIIKGLAILIVSSSDSSMKQKVQSMSDLSR